MSTFDARAEARRWFRAIWPGLEPDEDIIKLLGDAFAKVHAAGHDAGLERAEEIARGFESEWTGAGSIAADQLAGAIERERRSHEETGR